VRLDRDDIYAIARQVANLLDGRTPVARYADAAEVARILAVERDWVYAHAHQLGAIRLGGPNGRLRFDLHQLEQTLKSPSTKSSR
jgi:hypothetical protein